MNCKPGDMAVMVECCIPQSNGLIVEVLCPSVEQVPWHGFVWRCRTVTAAKSDQGFTMPGDFAAIPDAWLRPIRPGDTEDETPAEIIESLSA